MTASPYFHIGILVPDLDEAIERFGDVLGITFADRVYQDSQYFDDGGVIKDLRLHLTYSTDGPPYYELLEAQGDGLYSMKHGAGLHHVGGLGSGLQGEAPGVRRQGHESRSDHLSAGREHHRHLLRARSARRCSSRARRPRPEAGARGLAHRRRVRPVGDPICR